jgi:hypothetical protein
MDRILAGVGLASEELDRPLDLGTVAPSAMKRATERPMQNF